MAITQLDPRIALLVIDLQKFVVGLPTAHPAHNVVKLARKMLDAFRGHHLGIFPRLGETGTTQDIIDLLHQRA